MRTNITPLAATTPKCTHYLLSVLAIFCASNVTAQETDLASQLIRESTVIAGSIDPTQPMIPSGWLDNEADAQQAVEEFDTFRNEFAKSTGNQRVFFAIDRLLGNDVGLRVAVRSKKVTDTDAASNIIGTLAASARLKIVEVKRSNGWLVCSLGSQDSNASMPAEETASTAVKELFASALGGESEFAIQISAALPAYFRESFLELKPALPEFIPADGFYAFLENVDSTSVGLTPESLALRIEMACQDEMSAQKMIQEIPELTDSLPKMFARLIPPDIITLEFASLIRPTLEDSRVIIETNSTQSAEILNALKRGLGAMREQARKAQALNTLKQLIVGIMNYEAQYGSLPPGTRLTNDDGTQRFSWRVHILPFIGQEALYEQFHLDESWDSPHNLKIAEQMPQMFDLPMKATMTQPGHTCIVVPSGAESSFPQDRIVKYSGIWDGTSNTMGILIVRSEHSVPWTAPLEYDFAADPNHEQPLIHDGKIPTVFLDGAVHEIPMDISPELWRALITSAGGEVVDFPN